MRLRQNGVREVEESMISDVDISKQRDRERDILGIVRLRQNGVREVEEGAYGRESGGDFFTKKIGW